ncbi:MAG: VOC family protein, partial [Micromonosporaceae bacterium]
VFTSGLTGSHPASEYVQRHGDGVAVIALQVDDAAAAYAELVSRGADSVSPPAAHTGVGVTVVTAAVGGIGDVVHRLVERHGPCDEFLPGAVEMIPPAPVSGAVAGAAVGSVAVAGAAAEGAALAGAKLLCEIDHLAICVPPGELASTASRYREVFGFEEIFTERIEVAGQAMASTVVQSPSKQVTLVLLEPDQTRRPGQIDEFLRSHAGAGVQHLALRTDDIVTAVSALQARGVRFLSSPVTYYDSLEERVGHLDAPIDRLRDLGVLVDRDHWGQLLQIFTESMHVRRTLFLEVIERRGALTFGSGNVKALYEAKERELAAAAVPQTAGA